MQNTVQRRSNEEVERLKQNWMNDPCWDIENTEGFEAHHDELLAFSKEHKANCQMRDLAALAEIAKQHNVSIDDARTLRTAERAGGDAARDAVSVLQHLFKNAGVDYTDITVDLGDFVEKLLTAADWRATAERIHANAKTRPVFTPIEKPLTLEQMRDMHEKAEKGVISAVVSMDLSDLIDNDLEGFLDVCSEKLTGGALLADIDYRVVGHTEDTTILVEVSGDVSGILDDADETDG